MIGEIMLGNEFLGLCRYAVGEGKGAVVLVAQGVRWQSAEEMAADFEVQRASLRPALNQAVLHVALAWHPDEQEKITDKLMVQLTEEYLEGMGINPEKVQWALIRHHDQDHPHCHLIVNRVTHEGKALDCGNNYARSNAVCRELEAEHELIDAGAKGEARHRDLVERHALGEQSALELKVWDALDKHTVHKTSPQELVDALAKERVIMRPEFDAQGVMQTVVFSHEDHPGRWVKGSALGPEYGGRKLGETLALYAHLQRDPPWEEESSEWQRVRPPVAPSKYWLGVVELDTSVSSAVPADDEPAPMRLAIFDVLEASILRLEQQQRTSQAESPQAAPLPLREQARELSGPTVTAEPEWEM